MSCACIVHKPLLFSLHVEVALSCAQAPDFFVDIGIDDHFSHLYFIPVGPNDGLRVYL
jgi:hypothetical protein